MREDYKKLFTHLVATPLNPDVVENTWNRIKRAEQHRKKYRFFSALALFIASLVAFPYAVQYLRLETAQSGFAQYFSLLFSDGGTIAAYWKSFSLSLAESLPILSMTALFSVLGVTLFSLRQMILNTRVFPHIKFK